MLSLWQVPPPKVRKLVVFPTRQPTSGNNSFSTLTPDAKVHFGTLELRVLHMYHNLLRTF
jgi:hypothetical protein